MLKAQTLELKSYIERIAGHTRIRGKEVDDHLGQLEAQVVASAPACTATGLKLLKVELFVGARSKLRGSFNSDKHVSRYQ